MNYKYEGDVIKLLDSSPYKWKATGSFGLDILLGKFDSEVHSIYVNSSEFKKWDEYLRKNGAKADSEALLGPNIKLIEHQNLNEFGIGINIVVPLERLAEDLIKTNPRYASQVKDLLEHVAPTLHKCLFS